jgi:ABC-type glycerol-3-phosphate transport system substrate-binding protein
MPKRAVGIFFLAAFIGAAIYVYITFPRTKEEIPTSNNQRQFESPPGPESVPAPETVPHPDAPKLPPGPSLRLMAWATEAEAKVLQAETDAFAASSGRSVTLTVDGDPASYERDLPQAINSAAPPDVCLIAARNFSGIDPIHELATVTPTGDIVPRSEAAFTVGGDIKAVPDEFSVEVLFYNPNLFDQAGIGYPDRHWTWDIFESIARAMASLNLKNVNGASVYPVELPADFDFWNILCTQAGHPALDLDSWHLSGADSKESQMRALDLIHEVFQNLSVTAPLPDADQPPGLFFAQQRAAVLIAPSYLTASLPSFPYAYTVLPQDLFRGSLARVNGWAVTARASQPDAARALAAYLAYQPVHAGWNSTQQPTRDDTPDAVCYEALNQAVIPRIVPQSALLAQFLDQQIDLLARNSGQSTNTVYDRIQTEYESAMPRSDDGDVPASAWLKPIPKTSSDNQLRGL